ncbi:hypothetical protein Nepgr_006169 [Nepenthes gracilis]|uniref:Core Histone H2A/H2B/H3 domain-containing protein n=1 Tax=Nepenthes gracilis TaxID=150966 RepID=A0AAD3S4N0_NEPGR|nr:hypothetical protein Nepgr_006169 [Nepenthes gracilis]
MVSAESPVVFSKACELFILELTLRAWLFAEDDKRRTLQRRDIARAVRHEDLLQFLTDVATFDDHTVLSPSLPLSRACMHVVIPSLKPSSTAESNSVG